MRWFSKVAATWRAGCGSSRRLTLAALYLLFAMAGLLMWSDSRQLARREKLADELQELNHRREATLREMDMNLQRRESILDEYGHNLQVMHDLIESQTHRLGDLSNAEDPRFPSR